jgi:hypothetical protein
VNARSYTFAGYAHARTSPQKCHGAVCARVCGWRRSDVITNRLIPFTFVGPAEFLPNLSGARRAGGERPASVVVVGGGSSGGGGGGGGSRWAPKACMHWATRGSCPFGGRCFYSHDVPTCGGGGGGGGGQSSTGGGGSAVVTEPAKPQPPKVKKQKNKKVNKSSAVAVRSVKWPKKLEGKSSARKKKAARKAARAYCDAAVVAMWAWGSAGVPVGRLSSVLGGQRHGVRRRKTDLQALMADPAKRFVMVAGNRVAVTAVSAGHGGAMASRVRPTGVNRAAAAAGGSGAAAGLTGGGASWTGGGGGGGMQCRRSRSLSRDRDRDRGSSRDCCDGRDRGRRRSTSRDRSTSRSRSRSRRRSRSSRSHSRGRRRSSRDRGCRTSRISRSRSRDRRVRGEEARPAVA